MVNTTPEAEARQTIDRLLEAAGWAVQDRKDINLGASLGVAVREFPMGAGGIADHLLFVARMATGVSNVLLLFPRLLLQTKWSQREMKRRTK